MKKMPYRLLCTATAAPNDYTELGTSSEALGVMGYMDMLNRFYKSNQSNCALKTQYRQDGDKMPQWRFKKHAESMFWRWVTSWAKALPMVILIISAVPRPIRKLYFLLIYWEMASSILSPATLTDLL